ncbi:MAG UNVERIFIED_CONTAM: hypothetical protein LVR29_24775 [Microcystis novacekii LVE1205-3]|jgi:type I restriction enzyme R subunit
MAAGQKRMFILTMATGHRQNSESPFKYAWKLFHSSWNLTGEPTHRPSCSLSSRIAILLANQALTEFTAFPKMPSFGSNRRKSR